MLKGMKMRRLKGKYQPVPHGLVPGVGKKAHSARRYLLQKNFPIWCYFGLPYTIVSRQRFWQAHGITLPFCIDPKLLKPKFTAVSSLDFPSPQSQQIIGRTLALNLCFRIQERLNQPVVSELQPDPATFQLSRIKANLKSNFPMAYLKTSTFNEVSLSRPLLPSTAQL